MAKNTFVMKYRQTGRLKYLALTFLPPIFVMALGSVLFQIGLIPPSPILGNLLIYIPVGSIAIIGYFTTLRKHHTIDVKNNTLLETNWRGKVSTRIKAAQIACFRRNFLGEIILLDRSGSKLLCVESSMTNRDRFEQWLASHNIETK